MLQFPEGYFKSEERAGFMVGENVKRVWAAQIEVLYKISEICEKYGLTYYIFWGSLLGAVRHQGFIPWDDDLDIAMLGEDYIKFLEIAAEELPEGYHIFNPYTDDELDSHFTRVTNRTQIDLDGTWSDEYHGCPFSMGIDIFPLYYVPKDKKMAKEQKQILSFVKQLKDTVRFKNAHPELSAEEKKEYDQIIAQSLVDVQNMTGYRFTFDRPIARQLDMVFDQIARIATREESESVANFNVYTLTGKCVFDLKLFAETIQLPFENIMVTAPKEYDIILKSVYGNYMVPRDDNKMEEHQAFKSQARLMGQRLECIYFQKKNGGNRIQIKRDAIVKAGYSYDEMKALIPKSWMNRIFETEGDTEISKKTIILYYISVEKLICNSAQAVAKIRRVITTFLKRQDVLLWWLPSLAIEEVEKSLKNFIPETLLEYKELVEEYRDCEKGIYDESGDIARAIVMSDAYYGDESIITAAYRETGKWMMIQDYKV